MKTLFTALLLCVALLSVSATQQVKPQWEYKFEYKVNEKKANELAAQGWELITIGNESGGPMASVPVMVFRRSK